MVLLPTACKSYFDFFSLASSSALGMVSSSFFFLFSYNYTIFVFFLFELRTSRPQREAKFACASYEEKYKSTTVLVFTVEVLCSMVF